MIHIRHIFRTVAPVLVLVVVAATETAAQAIRVVPPGGNGTPITNSSEVPHGTPFWLFLLVAAGSVVLTLVVSRLFGLTRDNRRRRAAPA